MPRQVQVNALDLWRWIPQQPQYGQLVLRPLVPLSFDAGEAVFFLAVVRLDEFLLQLPALPLATLSLRSFLRFA